ncbi:MAG: tRNA lysidine(34) synthetase TilS [Candidatus Dadabacteria bacterium]|nr:tRNA lysidine(34) synthetase TilS [Candidatus Dadabacteria bacterium]
MLRPGDRVVVGLSGGADSVCLLYALHGLKAYRLTLLAAHLNHGIRGKEAARDAEFSRGVAESLGVEFELGEADAPALRKKSRLSLEDAARVLRYEFFENVRKKHGASRIATAHTLDDQAETVLMRLLRGSGTRGLSGIPPVSGEYIVRPLIETGRAAIESFLKSRRIEWIDDSTNLERDYLRNRIRLDLLPALKEYNPKIMETLARTADILRLEEDFISREAGKGFWRVFKREGSELTGNLDKYIRLHSTVRIAVLMRALTETRENLKNVSSIHLSAADAFLTSMTASGESVFPGGSVVVKGHGSFLVTTKDDLAKGFSYVIPSTGIWSFPELEVEIEEAPVKGLEEEREDVVYLDSDSVKFPIEVRSFKPGDRFVPLGMKSRKKVKDFFIDRKVPAFMRLRVPIFLSAGEIIWIGGMRIGERAKVKGKPEKVLKLTLLRPRF